MGLGFKSPILVTGNFQTAGVSVVTRVSSSISNQILVAANADRKGLLFYNQGTALQYIKMGATATITDFTVILTRNMFYEVASPVFLGQIDVISSSTNGAIQVTELT